MDSEIEQLVLGDRHILSKILVVGIKNGQTGTVHPERDVVGEP